MDLDIVPYIGVGPLHSGMTRDQVHQTVGAPRRVKHAAGMLREIYPFEALLMFEGAPDALRLVEMGFDRHCADLSYAGRSVIDRRHQRPCHDRARMVAERGIGARAQLAHEIQRRLIGPRDFGRPFGALLAAIIGAVFGCHWMSPVIVRELRTSREHPSTVAWPAKSGRTTVARAALFSSDLL